MAAIDPTPEEIQAWSNIGSVVAWAGMAGALDDPSSPAGSFLALLGFTPTAPIRVFGMIPEQDLLELLSDWKVGDARPTPAQRAQAVLIGSGARVAAGTQRLVAEARAAAEAALAAAAAQPPPAPAQLPQPLTPRDRAAGQETEQGQIKPPPSDSNKVVGGTFGGVRSIPRRRVRDAIAQCC